MEPKEYVDKIVADIKKLWAMLGIEYDRFIRTTDKDHEEVVQKYLKNYINREIYISPIMKAGIVHPVNPSGLKASL